MTERGRPLTLIERRRTVIEAVLDGRGEAKCPDCGDRLWWRWRSAGDAVKTSCDTCRIDEDVKMRGKYRDAMIDTTRTTWKTLQGKEIAIADLDTQHLANIIVMLAVAKERDVEDVPQWPALCEEARRRGLYPYGLDGGKLRTSLITQHQQERQDRMDHALGICHDRELREALQFLVYTVDHSKHVGTAMKRAKQVLAGLPP